MQNLRDKLLKAGVVDKKAKKKADHQARLSRKSKKKKRKDKDLEAQAEKERQARYDEQIRQKRIEDARREDERSAQAEAKRIELEERRRAEATERKAEQERLRERYRVRELLQGAMFLPRGRGPARFHFVSRSGAIRALQLSKELAKDLSAGNIGICQLPGKDRWGLASREVVRQVLEVEPELVRFFVEEGGDEDLAPLPEAPAPAATPVLKRRFSTTRSNGGGDRRDR